MKVRLRGKKKERKKRNQKERKMNDRRKIRWTERGKQKIYINKNKNASKVKRRLSGKWK